MASSGKEICGAVAESGRLRVTVNHVYHTLVQIQPAPPDMHL